MRAWTVDYFNSPGAEDAPRLSFAAADSLVIGVATIFAISNLVRFPHWSVDDAFITCRYAENLARHGELTWNVGENPVEGYTGIVLPVLLALASRLGAPTLLASKSIGVAAYFASALLLGTWLQRLRIRRTIRAATLVVFLTAPTFYTHATSGLETMLFCAIVLASLFSLEITRTTRTRRQHWECVSLALLLLAGLVRPEGVVLGILGALLLIVDSGLANRTGVRPLFVRVAMIFLLPGLAYFLWRMNYYGQLLPNTFYAKWSGRFSWDSITDAARFASRYMALPSALCVIAVCSGLTGPSGNRLSVERLSIRQRFSVWAVPFLGAGFAVVVLLQYWHSALIMNYSGRFFAPLLPIGLVLCAMATNEAVSRTTRSGRDLKQTILNTLLVSLVCIQLIMNLAMLRSEISFADSTRELLEGEHIQVGTFLRAAVPPDEWLVVIVDAGAIPYYSGLKTVDFGGLNDEFLSHRFRNRIPSRAILDYLYGHRPGVIVFTSKSEARIDGPEPIAIDMDPRFSDYVLVRSFGADSWLNYFELVFFRKDLAQSYLGAHPDYGRGGTLVRTAPEQ